MITIVVSTFWFVVATSISEECLKTNKENPGSEGQSLQIKSQTYLTISGIRTDNINLFCLEQIMQYSIELFYSHRYIYTDAVIIDSKNIKGLIYGSEKYMIQNLKEKCYKFLTSNVNTDHACIVFQTAHDCYNEDLKIKAQNLIFKNGKKCLESIDFLHLSAECLKLIVESDNLNCDEGIIFQRMVQWAKLRCGEQNKPTTDESVRNSLGDLLHLIRFPCMEPRFFTEEVSSTNILTFEEKVKIYEHFNLKWNDIFISKRRLGEIIHVVRCKVDTDSFFLSSSDCIDFLTSNNAELSSVLLFGSTNYSGSNDIQITILNGVAVLSTVQKKLESMKGRQTYEISLESPLKVCANTRYTIQLSLKGSTTFKGKDYLTKVTTKCKNRSDFVVTFIPNTDRSGQIPGLVFDI